MAIAEFGPRFLAPQGTSALDLLFAATFMNVWMGGASLATVPGGWSVACEISFYVALPALLWLLNGSIGRAFWLAAVLTIGAQLFAKFIVLRYGFDQAAFFNPIEHAPVFAYGVFAALVMMQTEWNFPSWLGLLPLSVALFILPASPVGMGKLMPQLPFAGLCAIAVAMASVHLPRVLAAYLIRKIGEVSYSMYLVHWIVLPISLWIAEHVFPAGNAWTVTLHFCLTSCTTFLIACCTYKLIEQPCIKWSHALA